MGIGSAAPKIQGVEVSWDRVADSSRSTPTSRTSTTARSGWRRYRCSGPSSGCATRWRPTRPRSSRAGLYDRLAHTRRHMAAFLGADPEGSALVPNASAATQIVFNTLGLGPGDEVLLTTHGYGAVRLAAGRAGAAGRGGPLPGRARPTTRWWPRSRPRPTRAGPGSRSSTTSPLRPRWCCRSRGSWRPCGSAAYRCWSTGPTCRACCRWTCPRLGADFWVGNAAQVGVRAAPDRAAGDAPAQYRDRVQPLVVSWQQPEGFPGAVEYGGTLDYTAWLAAPTGLHFLRTLGVDRVRRHNAELAAYGQRVVAEALGTAPVPGPWSPDVSMRLVRAAGGRGRGGGRAAAPGDRVASCAARCPWWPGPASCSCGWPRRSTTGASTTTGWPRACPPAGRAVPSGLSRTRTGRRSSSGSR